MLIKLILFGFITLNLNALATKTIICSNKDGAGLRLKAVSQRYFQGTMFDQEDQGYGLAECYKVKAEQKYSILECDIQVTWGVYKTVSHIKLGRDQAWAIHYDYKVDQSKLKGFSLSNQINLQCE